MGIYSQLARLAYRFPIHKSIVSVPVGGTSKLVDASPCRIYIAFSSIVLNGSLTVSPILPSAAVDGFASSVNPALFEFWIDRHMSLVGQQWFAFNASTSLMNVSITEVIYSDLEENHETALNAGQTQGEVFPSNLSR